MELDISGRCVCVCMHVCVCECVCEYHSLPRVALPTRIQKFTVLKSIHIFKKHRVQYEVRTHMRLMKVSEITGTTADIFLEYIQRNLPEGVAMSVYQVREGWSGDSLECFTCFFLVSGEIGHTTNIANESSRGGGGT